VLGCKSEVCVVDKVFESVCMDVEEEGDDEEEEEEEEAVL
jgi:hypothetical protein